MEGKVGMGGNRVGSGRDGGECRLYSLSPESKLVQISCSSLMLMWKKVSLLRFLNYY